MDWWKFSILDEFQSDNNSRQLNNSWYNTSTNFQLMPSYTRSLKHSMDTGLRSSAIFEKLGVIVNVMNPTHDSQTVSPKTSFCVIGACSNASSINHPHLIY